MKFDKPVHITIDSPHVSYEFDVRSKCTILRGDSATGKTTLIRLLDSGAARISSGGLNLVRLPRSNIFGWDNWVEEIMSIPENILLYTDEGDLKELSLEMQGVLARLSAAYLLITREMLTGIPGDQKRF